MSEPKILAAGWDAVTPAEAGWTYISFAVQMVAAGESFTLPVDGQERALVPLSGTAEVTADDQSWKLGGRRTVFDGLGWCLYLPLDTEATVTAASDLEIAIAAAPATTKHEPVLVTPDDTDIELRGGGNASRQVNSPDAARLPADRLHVIEVWTPGGNWSSYPPHKHEHDRDGESELEETYYYRLRDPENGWGVQRVYSPERDFDLVQTVRDGDLLLIPWGYHTTVAAHGHDLYYLNVLAGPAPKRTLQAFQDPCLKPPRTPGRRSASTPACPSSPAIPTDRHCLRPRWEGTPVSHPNPTTRLTVGQAVVRFLAAQQVERDGVEQQFFGGALGIFGHGNVAGSARRCCSTARTSGCTRAATSRAWSTSRPATRR